MSLLRGNQIAGAGDDWRELYQMAGFAAIFSELVILLGFVTYFIWPYAPGRLSSEAILLLLQKDALGGLISLDIFLFIGNLFSIFLFLALYVSLKQVNASYALVALALGLLGLLLLIPARPIVELFNLSAQYAVTSDPALKSQILAAATALLALFDGTGWVMNLVLGGLSLLASSLLMLRSPLFSKAAAWAGMLTNLVACLFFVPVLGKFFLFLSLPGYMIWYFLLAKRFFQMARTG